MVDHFVIHAVGGDGQNLAARRDDRAPARGRQVEAVQLALDGFDVDLVLLLVGDDVDLPRRRIGHDGLVGQPQVLRPVDRVRSVGQQFAQKNFFFRIQRMNHQIEHLLDLGFKRMRLLVHGSSSFLSD